jgi:hypothetical protein
MSNRLEQEFPELTWPATPPIGPGGVPPQVIRACVERGRELRSRAVRNSARSAGAALVRGLVAVAFVGGAGPGLAGGLHEGDRWPVLRRAIDFAGPDPSG